MTSFEWLSKLRGRLARPTRTGSCAGRHLVARRAFLEPLESRVLLAADFGDAPASYQAAEHTVGDGLLFLGVSVDMEDQPQPNARADGDDVNGQDDEDGLLHPIGHLLRTVGATPEVTLVATNTSGSPATLYGWIDTDAPAGRGAFDLDERAQITVPDGTIDGRFTLTFPEITAQVAAGLTGSSYARFRLSTDVAAADPGNLAADGEVEDYLVRITDVSDGIVQDQAKFSDGFGGFAAGSLDAGDSFGSSVVSLGDLDGDSVVDFAVGAMNDEDTEFRDSNAREGAVHVLLMNADGTVKQQVKITDGTLRGLAPGLLDAGDRFGSALAVVHGLDDDLDDGEEADFTALLIGASGDTTFASEGAVYLVFLNPDGTVYENRAPVRIGQGFGLPFGTLNPFDGFGSSIAVLGDLDGAAGPSEFAVAIGAMNDEDDTQAEPDFGEGAFYVLFMNRDGTVHTELLPVKITDNQAGFPADRLHDGDGFGASLAVMRQTVTGVRLAVGAPFDDLDDDVDDMLDESEELNEGAVHIVDLNYNASSRTVQVTRTERALREADRGDQFGSSVAALDLDGDSDADFLVVGAANDEDVAVDEEDAVTPGGGALYVWELSTNTLPIGDPLKISNGLLGFPGETLMVGDRFGSSLTDLGDLNGDGFSELAVGAVGSDSTDIDEGGVYVLYMNDEGADEIGVRRLGRISDGVRVLTAGTLDMGDRFGSSVVQIGDLDGDGVGDWVIGASNDENELQDEIDEEEGAIYLLLMNSDGTVKREVKIGDGLHGFRRDLAAGDHFGSSVAALGDLDRFGPHELAIAVGAPGDEESGAVHVLFLDFEPDDGAVTVTEAVKLTGASDDVSISGDALLGSALAGLTDVDGDGVTDLAVGAEGASEGAVFVVFMNRDGTIKSIGPRIGQSQGGLFDPALEAGDSFGSSLADFGDLDRDGVTDLVVGAKNDESTDDAEGAVYVLLLDPTGNVKSHVRISDGVGGLATGALHEKDFFGSSVAAVGDLNGDGTTDLAVGASGFEGRYRDESGRNADGDRLRNREAEEGALFLLLMNPDGTVQRETKIGDGLSGLLAGSLDGFDSDETTIESSDCFRTYTVNNQSEPLPHSGDCFGSSLAAVGDLDGDGVIDLVVGASGDENLDADEGAAYVLFINPDGTVKRQVKIGDGRGGFADGILRGGARFANAIGAGEVTLPVADPTIVEVAGDLNQDGIQDLVLGARRDENSDQDEGAIYVQFMTANGTVQDQVKISDGVGGLAAGSLDADDGFGSSIAWLGDLDGDGVHDLAVGAAGDGDAEEGEGAVFILFMYQDGTVKSQFKIADGVAGGLAAGTLGNGDSFGTALAYLGSGTLAVGAAGDGNGDDQEGAVYLLDLNSSGAVTRQLKISDGLSGFPNNSLETGDRFGSSLAYIESTEVLAIGAPGDESSSGDEDDDVGAVYLLTRNASGTVRNVQQIRDDVGGLAVDTLNVGDNFGASLAEFVFEADTDGDGDDEEFTILAVGAPGNESFTTSEYTNEGAVYLLTIVDRMATDQVKISDVPVGAPSGGLGIGVLNPEDGFGSALAAIDLDGDGLRDLAAGAFEQDNTEAGGGEVHLLMLNHDAIALGQNAVVRRQEWHSDGVGSLDAFDNFGTALTPLGDLDGDGVLDLAVGAANDDNADAREGAVYVLFMNPDGSVKRRVKISDGLGGLTAGTLDEDDNFGASLASFTFDFDLDDDGLDEEVTVLAVGAPRDESDVNPSAREGAVHLLLLNSDGTVARHSKISDGMDGGLAAGSLDFADYFGHSVAALGDIDGDGMSDVALAVGALRDGNQAVREGAVYVLLLEFVVDGNDDGDDEDPGDRMFRVDSQTKISSGLAQFPSDLLDSEDLFGSSVAGIGDLDGDGIPDLAVGAQRDDGDQNTESNEGAVYILLMMDDGTVKQTAKIGDGQNGFDVDSLDPGDYFGNSLAALGDLDGDGIPDLAVGARNDGDSDPGGGAIYLLLMDDDGTVNRQLKITDGVSGLSDGSVAAFDLFGGSIAAIGDLNLDGVIDLAVGAFREDDTNPNDGAVYVLSLSPPSFDYGDAPDPAGGRSTGNYETLAINRGPSHAVVPDILLGASVDGDSGLLENTRANADDVNRALPDDEDGVLNPRDLLGTVGAAPKVTLLATNLTTGTARIYGWIDYNRDGVFDNTAERAQIAVAPDTTAERFTLTFPAAPAGSAGQTYARFRFSTDLAAASATGHAADGEVEDYVFVISEPTDGTIQGTALGHGELDGTGTIQGQVKISDGRGGFGAGVLNSQDGFGSSVARLGDVDGDGVMDLAVGASGGNTAYLLLMHADGTVKNHVEIRDGVGGIPAGTIGNGALFGSSVAGLGDLNGDGVPDLVVGAAADTGAEVGEGAIYVLFLNASGTVGSFTKVADGAANGLAAGTLNPGDRFGSSAAALGDLDGDGVTELAVGASGDEDDANTDAGEGAVYVLFMNADGTVKRQVKITDGQGGLNGNTLDLGDRFGAAVAGLGDLNDDGVADLAVGASHDDNGNVEEGAVFVLFLNSDGTVRSQTKISDATGGLAANTLNAADHFGSSLTTLGDLDDNGVIDLAVGASGDESTDLQEGAVHVLLLEADGTVKRQSKISDGLAGLAAGSLDAADNFGSSLANVGDLDGDGVADLAVGAANDEFADAGEGAVYVLLMYPDGTVKRQVKVSDGLGGLTTGLLDLDDRFGTSLASLGDLDGDGIVDLAAGARHDENDLGTDGQEGAFYVLFMNPDSTLRSQQKITDGLGGFSVALDSGDWFGSAIAPLGDLDGDGVVDLAVGAPGDDNTDNQEGAVYLLFMQRDGTVKDQVKISDGRRGMAPNSLALGDLFGSAVAGIGDLDGDGVVDLAVGAPGAQSLGGAVHILFLNADGTVKEQELIDGFQPGDRFGSSLAAAGDLDLDGVVDLAVGSPGDEVADADEGAVYVLFMDPDGTVDRQVRISDGTVGGLAPGSLDSGDHFGSSVAAVGDLDGDGVPDLAVGAADDEVSDAGEGAIYLLSMNPDGTLRTQLKIGDRTGGFASETLDAGDAFGSSLVGMGDLDGDGIPELAVGALLDEHADDGEGAIYILRLAPPVDYGDAPDPAPGTGAGNYETLEANGGPSHNFTPAVAPLVFLGSNVDGENGAAQNATATADDLDGEFADDEQGVLSPLDLLGTIGAVPTITLLATNTSGSPATLYGWIDYTQDGTFDNTLERAELAVADGVVGGRFTLTFPVVPEGSLGTTFARFRLSTDPAAADSTGPATDGEVEDYSFTITDVGDGVLQSQVKISDGLSGFGSGSLDAFDQFGSSVVGLGDLDGDGVADLAVGASRDENGDPREGAVYVLMMNADGSVKRHVKISDGLGGLPASTLDSEDRFGAAIANLGDVDGDGVIDLAVGAPGDGNLEAGEGAVYVLFMNSDGTVDTNNAPVKITDGLGGFPFQLSSGAGFGTSLAGLGDFNNDNMLELAVGVPGDGNTDAGEGAVYVLFLDSDGTVRANQSPVKITDGTSGFALPLDSGDAFGSSVTNLGDLNNDGVIEIAVGAAQDENDGDTDAAEGAVYVLFLTTDGIVSSTQSPMKITDGLASAGIQLEAGDLFGSSLAGLGDLDGDGVADLAVGAVGDENTDSEEGAVYVLLLNPDGSAREHVKISDGLGGMPGDTLDPGDSFGSGVAVVGDLDGDGVLELAVGAGKDEFSHTEEGAVHLLFLNSNGTVQRHRRVSDGVGGLTVDLLEADDRLGGAVASLGDLDGDGVVDVAVGAPFDEQADAEEGAVYVLFLRGDGSVKQRVKISDGLAGLSADSLLAGDQFGAGIANLGDLNGDGVIDLVVGAPGDGSGDADEGAAYVLFMNSDGTVGGQLKIGDGLPGGLMAGSLAAGDGFGTSVAGIGDLDGDGVIDLLVGAAGDTSDEGAVHLLFLNPDGSVKAQRRIGDGAAGGLVPDSLEPGDRFGSSVAGVGDLDGDGVVDLVVGASGDGENEIGEGALYALLMNPDGTVKSQLKISDGVGGLLADSLDAGDGFGSAVGVIGDLDGDGVTDLVVGASGDGNNEVGEGAVYVLFLNADGSVKGQVKITDGMGGVRNATLEAGDGFGSAVTAIGDFDGNGLPDLMVGAFTDEHSDDAEGAVYLLLLAPPTDYGDAPDTGVATGTGDYETLDSSDGPRHVVVPELFLGAGVDSDLGNLQNARANADDVDSALPDDEDGVLSPLDQLGTVGAAPTVTVLATNLTTSAAIVYGWIDYDRDGRFESATESAIATVPAGTTAGRFTLTFPVVPPGAAGSTYLRLRLSTDGAAAIATGPALDGEVEDHLATIIDVSDGTVETADKISDGQGGLLADSLDTSDQFGSSVTAVGDLDGDGVTDLAVGAALDGNLDAEEGAVYLLFMNSDGTVRDQLKITDTSGLPDGTLEAGDHFGSAVAALGDLDGNGVVDLAVGAPGDDGGAVYLLFMDSTGGVLRTQVIADGQNLPAGTLEIADEFGSSLAALGDLNGDGVVDLAVGAQRDEGLTGGDEEGAVFVLFLNTDGTLQQPPVKITDGDLLLDGTLENGDLFGSSLAALGDLDGDGVIELAVGAAGDENTDAEEGAVYVLFLNPDGTIKPGNVKISDGLNGLAAGTLDAGDAFGSSVAALGDLDGDGLDDLVVGAANDNSSIVGNAGEGAIYVLTLHADGTVKSQVKISDGLGGLAAGTLEGGDHFGTAVAALGDLDGDGLPELAVGAANDENDSELNESEGAVYILRLAPPTDYGDAPDRQVGVGSYATRESSGGPTHRIVPGLHIGARVDTDSGSLQNAAADADDVDGVVPDDEDGVLSPLDLAATVLTAPQITLQVTNTTSSAGMLYGWIDYNKDGIFDAAEGSEIAVASGTTDGRFTLTFPVIPSGAAGTTYARFRLSTDAAAASPVGDAADGEVEDYRFTITDLSSGRVLRQVAIGDGLGGLAAGSLQEDDRFGSALAALGDLDGDGVIDMAVGAAGDQEGALYVLLMNRDGTLAAPVKTLGLDVDPLLDPVALFGSSLAPLGDLDGDGVIDLAVGAPGFGEGSVYVLFMNSDGTLRTDRSPVRIQGSDIDATLGAADSFGSSLAALGDLDGDGVADLAVGASGELSDEGAVFVLLLNPDGSVKGSTRIGDGTPGGLPIDSLDAGDRFGSSLAAAGDFDSNGVVDLAVGAAGDDNGEPGEGAIYVLLLDSDGTVVGQEKISDGIGGLAADALDAGDLFGSSLAALGDLDGDGVPDLAVGAARDDNGELLEGASYVLLMDPSGRVKAQQKISDDLGGLAADSLAAGDQFGSSLIALGDLDGDGVGDFVVGADRTTTGGTERGGLHVLFVSPAAGFRVSSWRPTDWGFEATFSGQFDRGLLNMIDTETAGLGAADAMLVGDNSGLVSGSLIVDASNQRIAFVRTMNLNVRSNTPQSRTGVLTPDSYTLTLRSSNNGFRSTVRGDLDGNADGIPGDDFMGSFVVAAPPVTAIAVGVPDIVRGPGQAVNVPANTARGIPLSLSESSGVRDVSLRLSYDPTLLNITAASLASGMPAGATVALDTSTPGTAIVTFSSPVDLPGGRVEFVYLAADVPADVSIYRRQQRLDVHDVVVTNAALAELPVIEDDAVHLATFFGDVSGDGTVNALDAARVARIGSLLDSGTAAMRLTDKLLIADVSRNGIINALDASKVAQFAALLFVPEIPPLPAGVVIPTGIIATRVSEDGSQAAPPVAPPPPAGVAGDDDSDAADLGPAAGVATVETVPETEFPAIDETAVDSLMSSLPTAAGDESDDDEELLEVLADAIEGLAFSE